VVSQVEMGFGEGVDGGGDSEPDGDRHIRGAGDPSWFVVAGGSSMEGAG